MMMMGLLLVLSSTPPGLAAAGWSETSNSGGVTAYARARDDSPIRETLAVGIIEAPPWVVKNAIDDYEIIDGAMPYLAEMKVLKRDERGTLIYHRTSPPFISSRDYTIRMRDESVVRDDGEIVYVSSWRVANGEGPPKRPGVVRVTQTEGYWRLEPLDGGKRTRGSYYVFADPGGSVPASIAEWGANTVLSDIFNAVRERAKNPKYWRQMPPEPPVQRTSAFSPGPGVRAR